MASELWRGFQASLRRDHFVWPYVVIKSAFWRILKTTLISRQLMNFTLIWSQPWFKKTVLTYFENNLDFKAIWTFHNVSPASFEKSVNNIKISRTRPKFVFIYFLQKFFRSVRNFCRLFSTKTFLTLQNFLIYFLQKLSDKSGIFLIYFLQKFRWGVRHVFIYFLQKFLWPVRIFSFIFFQRFSGVSKIVLIYFLPKFFWGVRNCSHLFSTKNFLTHPTFFSFVFYKKFSEASEIVLIYFL